MGATSAQVNAIVAPLGPALRPLEALIASTKTAVSAPSNGPTTTLPPITLSSLGMPTIREWYQGDHNYTSPGVGYKPAPPLTLDIAGQTYAQGGQFTWTIYNNDTADAYTWDIPSAERFSAAVGEQHGAPPAAVNISFLGNGKTLPFVCAGAKPPCPANSGTMTSLRIPLPSLKPASITLSLTGVTKLTVLLTEVYAENDLLENYTVDLANAVFTR
ncbi:MAG: hypothetical protein ACLQVK_20250 [Acidimicrobiales bacterium]